MEAAELCRVLEDQYFGPNMHEREEIELLPGLLEGVQVFVDVGASLGPYSFHTSKLITGGKMDFYLTDANISGALFKHFVPDAELSASLNWRKTEVPVVTLDELFPAAD